MKTIAFKLIATLFVAAISLGFTSCGPDDESGKTADSDLMGIWINEAFLNNPSYYTNSLGWHFISEGEVQRIELASTAKGLPSWFSSGAVKLLEYNGTTFYYKKGNSCPYMRSGKQIFVDPTGNNPEIGTLSSSNRLVLSDGAYIRVVDGKGKVLL